jgi:hypothetical protein
MKNFLNRLLNLKSYLPFNGDWLFVTETPSRKNPVQRDLAVEYDTPENVLNSLTSSNLDLIKFIYERAKAHEIRIENISNQIRDKAKIMLGTVSFVSAIFFGVIPFFTPSTLKLTWWAILTESLLFILLACHMIHSLMIAMDVITREESIVASPNEFLKSYENGIEPDSAIIKAYKNAIAQAVAYPIKTHSLLRIRINKLIMGQRAFQYGLIYFVILIFFHVFSNVIIYKSDQFYKSSVNAPTQEKLLKDLITNQECLNKRLDESINEISVLNKSDIKISEKQDKLIVQVRQLDKRLGIKIK